MSVEWSIADGVLHVSYESAVAKAEAHIPIGKWAVKWTGYLNGDAALDLAGGSIAYYDFIYAGANGAPGISFPLGADVAKAIWGAVTGAPKPTTRPQLCPVHKGEPLTREGRLWRCAQCDKEAAPKEAAHAVV